MPKTCPATISGNVNNARPGRRCGKRVFLWGEYCYAHRPETREARAKAAAGRAEARREQAGKIVAARARVLDRAEALAAMLFVDGIVRDRTMDNMSDDVKACIWQVAEAAFNLMETQR